MISDELARDLASAGVRWHPEAGDRFRIQKQALTEEVFTVSDMVIEEHHHESGSFFGFNGTTEWALDSVPSSDTLWLPREDQLRALLGAAFCSLEASDGGFVVVAQVVGHEVIRAHAADPADAYALAVLDLVALSNT
ncbi:MAG: pilus assembly protein CpaE [Beutenbergiaceae bacterium]